MRDLAHLCQLAVRFEEAIELDTKVLELVKGTKDSEREWPFGVRTQLAESCIRVGKFDQAERLLREVRQYHQSRENSAGERVFLAHTDGWQALSFVLQRRYAEAEPLAREAAAVFGRNAPNSGARRFYLEGVLGAALLGQQKYAEAEPILLQAYQGLKGWERLSPRVIRFMAEVGGWIVQLYEATNQPEKAREWREKLSPTPPSGR
jgi:hypothetical protein